MDPVTIKVVGTIIGLLAGAILGVAVEHGYTSGRKASTLETKIELLEKKYSKS